MILFLIIYIIYMIYRSMEAMHMLQQNFYNENNRYLKWIKRNFGKIFSVFDFIPILLFIIAAFIEGDSSLDISLIASMFIYLFAIYDEYKRNKENQNKIPLRITGRIKRLFMTLIIIYGVMIVLTVKADTDINTIVMLIILCLLLGFIYYVVYLANIINTPFNKIEYSYFKKKAKKKLDSYSKLEVIGITGSYGKTTSKNILNEILGSKYITRPTPKNYNTPYGLMMTINNYLDKFDEILIAEMGAYTNGDIKEICDLIHPKYGILTTIGEAHLETFKSVDNIVKTKFELIESLPSDGLAILNRDDPHQVNYNLQNNVKVKWIGIDNCDADVYATNIKFGSFGMSFDCVYDKNKKVHLKTKLLGSYNIYNILSSVALSLYMGISISEIESSVLSLKATEHRLELKKMHDIYMLDDAYNSNPIGAKGALDVLALMNGTKVVVTPGMVELGNIEKEKNYEFGKQISEVADYCILIGEKRTQVIYNGLQDNGFDMDNVFILNKVVDAYNVIRALKEENKDIYALFENDLPDIYTKE